jgi:peptidylprolyl isomerase
MPSQKEIRARQNRQKERVAVQLAERRRLQRRRRQFGGVAGVIGLVIVVSVGLAANNANKSSKVAVSPPSSLGPTTAAPPTTASTTATTVASAKGKPCVGLKSPLPKGSPPMLLSPGPPPTKLTTQDLKVGTGAVVAPNSKVTMNYVGVSCSTGKIFDSSYSRNQPFPANLSAAGHLIVGWQQGIPGMHVGGVRLLSIPSDLAYGPTGSAPLIAPDEPLFFLVEAVKLG